MVETVMKVENLKNGIVLGIVASALLLWGDKIRDPIVNWLNSVIPSQVSFLGAVWAPLVILIIGGIIGYFIDKT